MSAVWVGGRRRRKESTGRDSRRERRRAGEGEKGGVIRPYRRAESLAQPPDLFPDCPKPQHLHGQTTVKPQGKAGICIHISAYLNPRASCTAVRTAELQCNGPATPLPPHHRPMAAATAGAVAGPGEACGSLVVADQHSRAAYECVRSLGPLPLGLRGGEARQPQGVREHVADAPLGDPAACGEAARRSRKGSEWPWKVREKSRKDRERSRKGREKPKKGSKSGGKVVKSRGKV